MVDLEHLCEESKGILQERRFDGKTYCPLGKVDCTYRTDDRVKDFVDETPFKVKFYGCKFRVYKSSLSGGLQD